MRRLALGSGLAAVVARVAAAGCGFAMMALAARALPVADFGSLGEVNAYLNVAIIAAMLGHEPLSTRQAALGGPSAPYRHAVMARIAVAGCGAAALACLALVARGSLAVFAWVLVAAPLVALTRVEQGLVRGYGRGELAGVPDGVVRPASAALLTLGTIVLLRPGAGRADAIVVAWIAGAILAWGLATLLRRRVERVAPGASSEPRGTSGRVQAFEPGMYIGTLLSVATNQIPILAVSLFGARTDVALYAAADRLGQVVAMLPQAVFQAQAGRLAAAHRDGGVAAMAREYRRITLAAWKFALPAAGAVFILASPLLHIFGAQFVGATATLRIVCVATLSATIVGPVGLALMMTGHAAANSRGMAVGCAAQVALSGALVPTFGAAGAAWATLGATLVWVLLLLRQAARAFGRLPFTR